MAERALRAVGRVVKFVGREGRQHLCDGATVSQEVQKGPRGGARTLPFVRSIRRRVESRLLTRIVSLGAEGEGTTLVTGAVLEQRDSAATLSGQDCGIPASDRVLHLLAHPDVITPCVPVHASGDDLGRRRWYSYRRDRVFGILQCLDGQSALGAGFGASPA